LDGFRVNQELRPDLGEVAKLRDLEDLLAAVAAYPLAAPLLTSEAERFSKIGNC
jgi:hypothetical protein